MKFRTWASMLSTANDYSLLKWPSLFNSVLVTVLAFLILMAFQSYTWFTYESFNINKDLLKVSAAANYPVSFEYSTFGLWAFCTEQYNHPVMKCTTFISQTRPQYFGVINVLVTCSAFFTNLAIFPAWALTILILYNVKNTYISYISIFLWIVFSLLLLITFLNICAMIIVGLTQYYSPGKFISDTEFISFHKGSGLSYMLAATIISAVCFVIVIASLLWKKFIEMRLIEDEKELYRQLADDNYTPGWNKVVRIPRTASPLDEHLGEPPPYNPYYDRS